MKFEDYFNSSEDVHLMAQAETVVVFNVLMGMITKRRDELRKKNENQPKESPEDLTEDWRHINGGISELNWVLGLPERSRKFIDNIEQ